MTTPALRTSMKAGGYASAIVFNPDYDLEYGDENAVGYELGLRSSFADGILSATAFLTDFDDLQVAAFDNVSSAVRVPPPSSSAASSTSTEAPPCAIATAALSPFGPEPITTASRSLSPLMNRARQSTSQPTSPLRARASA